MRVLFLGNISGNLDEGMKNATYHLTREISNYAEIELISAREGGKYNNFKKILDFSPDIIHYMMGPTYKGLFLSNFLKSICNIPKLVVSTPRPQLNRLQNFFLFGLKPNLMLVHSHNHEQYFRRLGYKTLFFPLGVDINKFKPIDDILTKSDLKKKLNLNKFNRIMLHVGQLTQVREVDKLIEVQKKSEFQVVIISATSIKPELKIKENLLNEGIIIIEEYINKLEEYYQVSDVFVFPGTLNSTFGASSAIELPLSVLEAMACGLPVITGKFGGLPDLFYSDICFRYAQNSKEILKELNSIPTDCKINREKVKIFSWENLGHKLFNIYSNQLYA